MIEPTELGTQPVEVTLRSPERADAVRKTLIVEPEGTTREWVSNGILGAGESVSLPADLPSYMVADSGKVLLNITPSIVAQAIEGLDQLLQMPFGCGEQNMIGMAPDVQVLRYFDATGQNMPEVRAKAEHFITVGYQRELTYRHDDGSFSAFGPSDETGSLWLTAFVLKVFSDAVDYTSIDEDILEDAAAWIESLQNSDGSWEPYGFVCHTDMMGGAQGVFPLTAFVALALSNYDAGSPALSSALNYLAAHVSEEYANAYSLAIAGLLFARMGHSSASGTLDRLLELAKTDDDGLYWEPLSVETTAYAALALYEANRTAPVNEAISWLVAHRNSLGGYTSTQDTVMALEALLVAAAGQSRDVSLRITAREQTQTDKQGEPLAQFEVDQSNFDLLQMAELPVGGTVELSAEGTGEVAYQLVRRFNELLPDVPPDTGMNLNVEYSADHVAVDDLVDVEVSLRYRGDKDETGMLLIDVGVPTGFDPVQESLDAVLEDDAISRYEIAGRKVIFYIDGLEFGDRLTFTFQVKARFPVRAITPDSYAYEYYDPEVRAEVKGKSMTVDLEGGDSDDEDAPVGCAAGPLGPGPRSGSGDVAVWGVVVILAAVTLAKRRTAVHTGNRVGIRGE